MENTQHETLNTSAGERVALTGRRRPWPGSFSWCCSPPGNTALQRCACRPAASSPSDMSGAPRRRRTAAQQPPAGSLEHSRRNQDKKKGPNGTNKTVQCVYFQVTKGSCVVNKRVLKLRITSHTFGLFIKAARLRLIQRSGEGHISKLQDPS